MLKKNLFFVIFGMLALCAMLAMACNGGGGDDGNKEEPEPTGPTPQELADAAIASMSAIEVGTVSLSSDGNLSFTLTGGTKGLTVTLNSVSVGGSNATLTSSDKATDSLLTISTNTLVLTGTGEFVDAGTAVAAVVGFTAKAGTATATGSKSLTIPAASIATFAPAISALRQVKTELAKAGSATITGETSAGSVGTITVETGSISLAYGGSASIILTGGTYTEVSNTFESSLMQNGDIAIGTLTSNVLGITDTGYGGTAGTTLASGSVGTYTAAGTIANGSTSTPFQPLEYGSVSASFGGLILNAQGLIYNVSNPFVVTVYTTRPVGAGYDIITSP